MDVKKQPVTLFKETWVWSHSEEKLYRRLCKGFTLHLCSGTSRLGDVKADLKFPADIKADMYNLPFKNSCFDTTICDPPWHGPRNWNKWRKLMKEITRVTRKRIIFVLGKLIFIIPKPWELTHVFILKKISPQIKLVYVWEKLGNLERWLSTPRKTNGARNRARA